MSISIGNNKEKSCSFRKKSGKNIIKSKEKEKENSRRNYRIKTLKRNNYRNNSC